MRSAWSVYCCVCIVLQWLYMVYPDEAARVPHSAGEKLMGNAIFGVTDPVWIVYVGITPFYEI